MEDIDAALGYATRLLCSLMEKHFPDRSAEWAPLPDLYGVLTQIDNLTTGLTRSTDQPTERNAAMNFGQALDALKAERWVRRAGWNGRGMHLYLEDSLYRSMPRADVKGRVKYTDQGKYEPCIVMFTARQKHQPGWLASQADMLADDWEIVPYEEMT